MSGTIEARLEKAGLKLPQAAAPVGNYVAHVTTGNLVFVSGQLPNKDGQLAIKGCLGDGVSIEQGQEAAKLCALNLIAQLKAACGDLDRVKRVVKLTGFVCSTTDFTQQAAVLNGASNLMVEVFGEAGKHTRVAVSSPTLPLGAAVEIDGLFEIGG
jgi:enamine deaminase RidA (YjgF/YER057c/UK114 family)